MASRNTATAASGSRGGPHTPGPASCMAPYPMRAKIMEVLGSVKLPPSLLTLFSCPAVTYGVLISFLVSESSGHSKLLHEYCRAPFSRILSGLNMRLQPSSALKIDMLKTSRG